MTLLQIETRTRQLERKYTRLLRERFNESYKKMSSALADILSRMPEISYSEAMKYERYDKLMSQINSELNTMKRESERLLNRSKYDFYLQNGQDSIKYIKEQIGSLTRRQVRLLGNVSFLSKERLLEVVATPYESLSLRHNFRNVLSDIESVMTTGFTQGSSYQTMARELRDRINVSYNKAMRVLRTEGTLASTRGQSDAYERVQRMGIALDILWVTAEDEKVRPSHRSMNDVVKKDKGFYIGGMWVMGPGDPSLPAKHRVNCRCRLKPVIKQETDES